MGVLNADSYFVFFGRELLRASEERCDAGIRVRRPSLLRLNVQYSLRPSRIYVLSPMTRDRCVDPLRIIIDDNDNSNCWQGRGAHRDDRRWIRGTFVPPNLPFQFHVRLSVFSACPVLLNLLRTHQFPQFLPASPTARQNAFISVHTASHPSASVTFKLSYLRCSSFDHTAYTPVYPQISNAANHKRSTLQSLSIHNDGSNLSSAPFR